MLPLRPPRPGQARVGRQLRSDRRHEPRPPSRGDGRRGPRPVRRRDLLRRPLPHVRSADRVRGRPRAGPRRRHLPGGDGGAVQDDPKMYFNTFGQFTAGGRKSPARSRPEGMMPGSLTCFWYMTPPLPRVSAADAALRAPRRRLLRDGRGDRGQAAGGSGSRSPAARWPSRSSNPATTGFPPAIAIPAASVPTSTGAGSNPTRRRSATTAPARDW